MSTSNSGGKWYVLTAAYGMWRHQKERDCEHHHSSPYTAVAPVHPSFHLFRSIVTNINLHLNSRYFVRESAYKLWRIRCEGLEWRHANPQPRAKPQQHRHQIHVDQNLQKRTTLLRRRRLKSKKRGIYSDWKMWMDTKRRKRAFSEPATCNMLYCDVHCSQFEPH